MALDARTVRQIVDEVDRRRESVVRFAADLVRIPSETHPPGGDEGPVQRFIEERLARAGLEVDVFEPWSVPGVQEHPGWWPGLEYTDRPNVVGVRRGTGGGRSLILNGHCDVVPAGPRQLWADDPYGGVVSGGRLYGRGAADQKGGLAAMIVAVEVLADLGLRPRGDVVVESVVNEELGGYNGTVACCAKGYLADAAIVTEPTGLEVVAATKGGQTYKATVPGINAHHAWWWQGVSAFDKAIVVKEALVAWERLRAAELSSTPYFSDTTRRPRPALADTVWYVGAGDPNLMASPSSAELHFWVDVLPADDREAMLARFERFVLDRVAADPFLAAHPPRLERALMRPFDGVEVPAHHPVVNSLLEAFAAGAGRPTTVGGLDAATDSMIFNLYTDTPAVVFGPTGGGAHSPDEYVEIDGLLDCTKTLAVAIVDFCGVADA
ncbi:ArgE/DapE family deacylase [Georgenia sp. AZ-5]|uniref:ArgE/DapE family deacylase n=1 Tax=Georgenia sp. AZ-5 TaxID=3367526 RepID=UPI003754540C